MHHESALRIDGQRRAVDACVLILRAITRDCDSLEGFRIVRVGEIASPEHHGDS